MRLLDGFVTTQLLYVAAELGVAEVLADGPRSGAEIAAAVGVAPGPLVRVLRGLVIDDVLAEEDDGRFALTPVGACLPALRGSAQARADLYYRAAPGLLDAVRAGGTAFEHVYGEPFFGHLEHDAAHQAAFEASMAGRSAQEARDVVDAYDFTPFRRLVDVGGGRGVLLGAVLAAAPELHGVLVDREPVIPAARAHLDAAGVGDRAECVPGDFFDSVPEGADAYLVCRVLHDWPDADAARVLAACRRAMTPDSRLLVVDAVLPVRAHDAPAVIRMDLHMLLLFGARERTEHEFRTLFAASGFELQDVTMTASPAGLGILTAAPSRSM
jgi:SAM-dependent methyltransferase